ncbi:MAG TPA: hypothetical protein PLP27_02020 [Crocinitomicaceae bacterium]|nr:hypothetical protein [Crocinitomicaceae bacterium]
MKYVFTFLFVSITCISFGQLKAKHTGWYQGEMKAFTLYQNIKNVDDQADFIKIEASSICLFLHENSFTLYIAGQKNMQGTFEVQTISKKEQHLLLKSFNLGTFRFILDTKKKFLILTDKEQQPPVIMQKLKKKAQRSACG